MLLLLLLLLLFKSLYNKQHFSILAIFLFDRHLEFCLLFYISLEQLKLDRLLNHTCVRTRASRIYSLWRWRQRNRTSLCLHWLNFLLCWLQQKTKKRDRDLFPVRMYNVSYEIIDNFLRLYHLKNNKTGKNHWNIYWTFLLCFFFC